MPCVVRRLLPVIVSPFVRQVRTALPRSVRRCAIFLTLCIVVVHCSPLPGINRYQQRVSESSGLSLCTGTACNSCYQQLGLTREHT